MSPGEIPPPEWFAGMKYDYPDAKDSRRWLHELQRIKGLSWAGREEWRDIIPDIDDWNPAYIGPPTVEAVDREEAARELYALERPALLVRVHLGAPDAVILEKFRAVLVEARKTYAAPVKNRGRDSLKGRFSPSKLKTWRDYHIIELAELLAWREREWPANGPTETDPPSRRRPSDAQLGRWLGFQTPGEVAAAMQALETALNAIPALWAQVNSASK